MDKQHNTASYSMIKFSVASILFLFFLNINAQEKYTKLPETHGICPTIIVNDNIISNYDIIKNNKQFVAKISVMKDKPNRKDHRFYNLSENGIILVDLDQKVKSKSQCDLNRFFGLDKKNEVYVNGYLVEDTKYKIATESIIEIELIIPNSINKLKSKSINVWTLTKQERIEGCKQ
ncbi:hypothetical protein [uncultured Winogradskyella sp.]|uniref:hypothetical protein n=1 Tax=uncultured Winogradskyella sp. TaxID=395353 RepID=UPI002634564C|nr:hypothetical protein [uncultured Winogradskyella sp.]